MTWKVTSQQQKSPCQSFLGLNFTCQKLQEIKILGISPILSTISLSKNFEDKKKLTHKKTTNGMDGCKVMTYSHHDLWFRAYHRQDKYTYLVFLCSVPVLWKIINDWHARMQKGNLYSKDRNSLGIARQTHISYVCGETGIKPKSWARLTASNLTWHL